MPSTRQRLYINVDHVATLRQARRGMDPDPVVAAAVCEDAGADGITAHLREDRRHIQDHDIERLAESVRGVINLEMALTDEMLTIAGRIRPYQVTLVPERRQEITTEGGLDVSRDPVQLGNGVARLRGLGVRVSLFIDPDPIAVSRSREAGADAIELHTGSYANAGGDPRPVAALRAAARRGADLGLAVHAGHGLTAANVAVVAAIPEVEELNVGHAIIARAVMVGLAAAVGEFRAAMDAARGGVP
jgi:pyridoxine 5-phosphate synthase